MEHYIKNKVGDITYLSEFTHPPLLQDRLGGKNDAIIRKVRFVLLISLISKSGGGVYFT
jgi:hypothetical protein